MNKKLVMAGVLALIMSTGTAAHGEVVYDRIAGGTRYETSIAISQKGWQKADVVIIATGENYSDALGATPLSHKYDAPILLTESKVLTETTSKEIKRLGAKKAYILGGVGAVSTQVEQTVQDMGLTVTRIGGANRYETAVKIAENLDNVENVAVVYGEDFGDALSFSSICGVENMPILLKPKNGLPDTVKDYVAKCNPKHVYIALDKNMDISEDYAYLHHAIVLDGKDKFERNITIIHEFEKDLDFSKIAIATGENYPDALSGSALAAKEKRPIFLLGSKDNSFTTEYLKKMGANAAIIFGGAQVVPQDKAKDLLEGK